MQIGNHPIPCTSVLRLSLNRAGAYRHLHPCQLRSHGKPFPSVFPSNSADQLHGPNGFPPLAGGGASPQAARPWTLERHAIELGPVLAPELEGPPASGLGLEGLLPSRPGTLAHVYTALTATPRSGATTAGCSPRCNRRAVSNRRSSRCLASVFGLYLLAPTVCHVAQIAPGKLIIWLCGDHSGSESLVAARGRKVERHEIHQPPDGIPKVTSEANELFRFEANTIEHVAREACMMRPSI